ncbi:MAG: transporter substrate-binding domain-containing protein [Selenomonadaceae bacterium]|nr:transporter substrate-binding domain-containing protein [Selenomonadaceae bacterium]
MTKKLFALLATLCLLLTGCGSSGDKTSAPAKDKTTIGVISHLNASEKSYNELMKKLENSYRPSKANLTVNFKYFNRMSDMLAALEANQIDMMSTYNCVANYIISRNDNLEVLTSERSLYDSFCFAVREDDKTLLDELNRAIKEMSTDGTLSHLVKDYITDLKFGAEPPAVPITHIDGADTIKVAVTGDLPPFDLVLADGKPAGFSTAVLAEVSRRIGKNIELVNVDSGARAEILSSKGADVLFWVSVPKDSKLVPADIDKPAGVAISDPYFSDEIVHVDKK